MSKLKETTTTGPDELPASLLKEVAPIIAPTIAKFFNLSSQGTFPQRWKQANIYAVYKSKGSKTDPAYYISAHLYFTRACPHLREDPGAGCRPAI